MNVNWKTAIGLFGVTLLTGSIIQAQGPAPAPAPAAVAERKNAETAEAPSVLSGLEPAVVTFGMRAWEKGAAEGIGDLVLPVYSTRSGLFFLNPRSSFRDEESEMNLGAGYRQLIGDRKMILGVNAYYDQRETESNNRFHQAGFGVEFLSEWVDARANYYLPDNDVKTVSTTEQGDGLEYEVSSTDWDTPFGRGHTAVQKGIHTDSTMLATPYTRILQREQAMEGFDCELGVRLPIPIVQDWSDVKVFAGYYRYDNDISSVVEGWKGRLEVRALPAWLVDAEVFQDDDLNGSSYYIGSRLQVPFDLGAWAAGKNPFAGTLAGFKPTRRNPAKPFDSRLTDMVMRDPRVQTKVSAPLEITTYSVAEVIKQAQKRVSDVLSDSMIYVDKDNTTGIEDGTFSHPYNTIVEGLSAAGGDMDTVYVLDSKVPYTERIVVKADGIALIGSGSGLAAHGGKNFATGVYPVLKSELWKFSTLGTLTIVSDDVLISGFEFQGRFSESLGDLIRSVPDVAALKTMLSGTGKDIGIEDVLVRAMQLSGIVALDANNLTVYDNIFRNQAVGVLSINGSFNSLLSVSAPKTIRGDRHAEHQLFVGKNQFSGNGIGLLAIGIGASDVIKAPAELPAVPSTVLIAQNTFTDNLIGLGVLQAGGGLNVLVSGNQFDNKVMPAGVGALIGNVYGDLNAVIAGNTIRGSHTLGVGLVQEVGDLNAKIIGNSFQACQVAALAVEANVVWLSGELDKSGPVTSGDVNLWLHDNLFAGTTRSIAIPEWLLSGSSGSKVPDDLVFPVPAVVLALAGNTINVNVSQCEFNDNAGGALLGLAYADQAVNLTVEGVTGRNNGTLFEDFSPIVETVDDWNMDDEFPTLGDPLDYSFVMIGDPGKGVGLASMTGSGFENSGKTGVFIGDLDPLIADIVDAL